MAPIKSIYVPKGMVLKVEYRAGKVAGAKLLRRSDEKNDHTKTIYRNTIECVEQIP
jgi:hypothetical protein